jgi:hypothetical protein
VPGFFFTTGEAIRHTTWIPLGWALYALGAVAVVMIIAALILEFKRDVFARQTSADEVIEPQDRGPVAPLMISDTVGTNTSNYFLPATEKQLQRLADGLINQATPFSQRYWCGAGKPFSINAFNALRDEMQRRGLAYQQNEKDPRQGYALTVAGARVLKKFLPSPTLQALQSEMVDR